MTISDVISRLREMDKILILTHIRPDGDTIGSAAALCRALRNMGKTAFMLPNSGITETYAAYAAPYWAEADFIPEAVVSVDIATLDLLPDNARVYADRIALAIDHHPSHSYFAAESYVEPDAAACGEILFEIIRRMTPITREIALPLYVAISTDCGCFQYGNTTSRSHRIAAELMELVDVGATNTALFRKKSRVRLAMESRMVSEMEFYDEGRVVVMTIPLSLREEFRATEADIEELSSLAAQVEGTDCGITLRELRPGTIKISLRTGSRVDACAACAKLGGGGHRAASGATVEGSMDEVKCRILQAVREVTI